jgi:hypothetical protein
MTSQSPIDYSVLDRPEVLMFLFHPRPESDPSFATAGSAKSTSGRIDELIPVADQVSIGARFHMAHAAGANIIFFHGNGEIVADYDELGGVYNQIGMNFLAVDYRGYGRSTGQPTVSAMMSDCHIIFEYVSNWLKTNDYPGPIILMGRSLGSASALELAAAKGSRIDGLIIESGFAYAEPLLRLLGVDAGRLGFKEENGFRNVDKIRQFNKPSLIIHAEFDHIIPFADGQALYDASPAEDKTLLMIPGANHNDIFMQGLQEYLAAVKKLADILK